jgi:uncharacterized protein
MKHPLFECLGDAYPHHLEERYDRILTRIEELWESPAIDDYFSDLLIDKRGGRQGFPREVLNDILRLREFCESERLREAETREDAIEQLAAMGYSMTNQDFWRAVLAGDKELVDLYVRATFNIHQPDEHGNTPMMAALKRGYTVVALILLKAGADVNAADKLGLTPLLVACGKTSAGFRSVTEALIHKGAYINVRDRLGNTPFLLAVSGDMLDIAELLAERGADMSVVNRRGESAEAALAARSDPRKARIYLDELRRRASRKASPQTPTAPTSVA